MEAAAGAIYPLEEAIDHISIIVSAQCQAKSTGDRLSSTGDRLSDKRRSPVKNARLKANVKSDFLELDRLHSDGGEVIEGVKECA